MEPGREEHRGEGPAQEAPVTGKEVGSEEGKAAKINGEGL